MFSLSNDNMNKMTEDNPILAMMQSAFANDNDAVKKTTDAWIKAMPGGENAAGNSLAAQQLAAMAASSAVGFGIYNQMMGTMLGAMTSAMEAAEKMKEATENSEAPFGMLFNPLTFEWSDVNSAEREPKKAKKTSKPKAVKPEKSEDKTPRAKKKASVKLVAENAVAQAEPKELTAPSKSVAAPEVVALPEPAPAPEPLPAIDSTPVVEAPQAAAPVTPVVSAPEPTIPVASAEIMPEDFKRPQKMEKPETPDDLKLISGIGPKLEQVLNGMGIWTFGQIAKWAPEEIAYVDDYLQFKGRIERDDWLKQAAALEKA